MNDCQRIEVVSQGPYDLAVAAVSVSKHVAAVYFCKGDNCPCHLDVTIPESRWTWDAHRVAVALLDCAVAEGFIAKDIAQKWRDLDWEAETAN
jgi:hypothetical protein